MHLRFLEFAEYAAFTEDKKLVVSGIFNSINAVVHPDAPPEARERLQIPTCSLVWILEASLGEGLTHHAELRVRDADSNVVSETTLGPMQFILNSQGRPMRFQGRVVVGGLALPGDGEYAFEMLIDGSKVGEALLYVDVRVGPPPT